eukprot:TRINITY_DN15837_c0_g1_i1.p1 TRINITY_DN15837_c0_g1~~TRINITY_DN15837_c0_g1_i1.p1  ORF type:complete len:341 (-),score=67.69 TRINITY_DN15837_c0_g1_i1:54-1076(-)
MSLDNVDGSLHTHGNDRRWERISVPRFLALGLSANVTLDVLIYPAEVLKTRLQVDRSPLASLGTIGYARHIYAKEGIKAFYRGFWWQGLGGFPSLAIYYLSYNVMKDKLTTHLQLESDKAKSVAYMASGIMADVFAILSWVPVDVVMQRLQIQTPERQIYKDGFDAIRQIVRTEGIRGLYRGTGAAMLTYAPASGVWWVAYENAKLQLAPFFAKEYDIHESSQATSDGTEIIKVQTMEKNSMLHMSCGMAAGFLSAIVSNPFDVCKTRLQTQHASNLMDGRLGGVIYKNTFAALSHIVRTEGFRALFRGFWPRALFAAPASAGSSLLYEKILNMSMQDSA